MHAKPVHIQQLIKSGNLAIQAQHHHHQHQHHLYLHLPATMQHWKFSTASANNHIKIADMVQTHRKMSQMSQVTTGLLNEQIFQKWPA